MKLVLLIITTGLLIFGSLKGEWSIAITGAIFFTSALMIDLIWIYKSSKQYSKGIDEQEISVAKGALLILFHAGSKVLLHFTGWQP